MPWGEPWSRGAPGAPTSKTSLYSPPQPRCGAWDTPFGKLLNTVYTMMATCFILTMLVLISLCRCMWANATSANCAAALHRSA